ncbi:hypothetical protein SXIM_07230 [Streptomyces xiamenensis]|uniref:Uncharacterized protein n=1 Tax=Streptomyces xiamenensis TaxID=408015 RepID=A0A0F7FRI7_9ACTN|nr:hypothetical protein SXIM_07230 [Streptomyces xiamenensis]
MTVPRIHRPAGFLPRLIEQGCPVRRPSRCGIGARVPFGPTWDPLAAGRPKAVVY